MPREAKGSAVGDKGGQSIGKMKSENDVTTQYGIGAEVYEVAVVTCELVNILAVDRSWAKLRNGVDAPSILSMVAIAR